MIAAGPGYLGYGASLLWTGPHHDKPSLYELRVTPGDAVVRRQADQLISALPMGMKSPAVMKLYARYKSSAKWDEIAMQPAGAGDFAGGYQFMFASLPENVEYYVTAGAMTSKHFNIRVTDLPSVKQIRVTYRYPAWTGIPTDFDERAGDLRAVEGTTAELDVMTDRPLNGGQILLDSGQKVQLSGGQNNVYHGSLKMEQDGVYHIAGVEQGQPVRISEDFFIEAKKANPPQIALVRPGRGDYHASPIEEVTVAAKASGDYALKDVELHYSVNGGPEVAVDLLTKKGNKQAEGSTTLSLEKFMLQPGDLISVYATAKNANAEGAHRYRALSRLIRSNANFRNRSNRAEVVVEGVEEAAIPSAQISRSAKKRNHFADLQATGGQEGDCATGRGNLQAAFPESQATLRDQAMTLSGRLQRRELTEEVQAISDFQKDMIAASKAMDPAAQQLQNQKWKDAIPNEQKALQYLLRAEATYRQIQVAFGRGGGGGGGGGGGAARDLAALFDLELDTEKNQYETGQQAKSASAEQRAQEVEDALKKLDELAKRESDLAQQQRNSSKQTAEQKWQQEMLQREAQQLEQQMQQQARAARSARTTGTAGPTRAERTAESKRGPIERQIRWSIERSIWCSIGFAAGQFATAAGRATAGRAQRCAGPAEAIHRRYEARRFARIERRFTPCRGSPA